MVRAVSGLVLAVFMIFMTACRTQDEPQRGTGKDVKGVTAMGIMVTSTAFENGERIPRKYTCDGNDISPPLAWSGVPDGAASLALICDDPDAPNGTFVHWVLYNLPPGTAALSEYVPPKATTDNGAAQGRNDFGKTGYGGPCPPRGATHRYFFRLYALDTLLGVPEPVTKQTLVATMKGHVLGEGELMGTYERQ